MGKLTHGGSTLALAILDGTLYVGLSTAVLTDTATMSTLSEVTETGYSRQSCTFTTVADDGTGIMKRDNTAQAQFSFSTGGTTIKSAFVCSSASGTTGNLLAICELKDTAGNTITPSTTAGSTFTIQANQLVIKID